MDPDTGEKWDRCRVFTREGIAFNVHQCMDDAKREFSDGSIKYGNIATCHNNCKGVEPSSIIGAGVAAVVATGIAGQTLLPAVGAVGIGGLGVLGGREALEMIRGPPRCTNRQCLVRSLLLYQYFTYMCLEKS